ncbi:hypothetical protein [Anaerospora hongkongensis]|uniref:hypothetical protein n=1 Tax=Anaerospora hongkongensis TaxID=244830 RepID=UPI002897A174|nr:hypothetical protein [Anaerospora hongkongensis]
MKYILPPEHGDSWMLDVHPAPGLCVSNAYFTLQQSCVYKLTQPGLWLCSLDDGDITLIERGRKKRKFKPGLHVIIKQDKQTELVLGSGDIRYTCIWVSAGFIEKYLEYRTFKQPFAITDALKWQLRHYNTPELLMVWEQLKFGIRNAVAPLMYFESKVIELLALIMRNVSYEWYGARFIKTERPKHLTHDNGSTSCG